MKKFKMSIKKTQIIMLSFVLFFIAQMVNAKENIKNYSAKNVLDFVRIAQVLPSPDSSEVAYVTYSVDASLQDKKWVYSLYIKNKLNQTKLIVRTEDIESINYSPDGTKIIYLAPGKKFQSIWIVDTNSNLKKKLYEFTQDISVFKISPNSQNIAFLANSEKTTPTINKPIDESKNYQNSQLYNVSITNVNLVKAITNADISVTDFD